MRQEAASRGRSPTEAAHRVRPRLSASPPPAGANGDPQGTNAGGRLTGPCLLSVVQVVCADMFGVTLAEMQAPSRGRAPVAQARQTAMYLANVALGLDHRTVGVAFNRDRTTATYACQTVEDRREDPHFDRILDDWEMFFLAMRRGVGCPRCGLHGTCPYASLMEQDAA